MVSPLLKILYCCLFANVVAHFVREVDFREYFGGLVGRGWQHVAVNAVYNDLYDIQSTCPNNANDFETWPSLYSM